MHNIIHESSSFECKILTISLIKSLPSIDNQLSDAKTNEQLA